MPITDSDIKLLASQRLTDEDDGGGRMTGTVIQSGVDNNLFDDVSNLDRVYGRVSLRKAFAAVLTADTDKYLGARVIIDQAPEDANVHGLIFPASSAFDVRADTTTRVQAYLAPGAAYQGLLFGNHLAGQSTVTIIQRVERPIPQMGDVLMLRKNEGLTTETDQYVRVTAVSAVVQTFTDASNQPDFQRMVLTMSISDPLREAFPGFDAVRADAGINFTGKTKTYATIVADAAQYYGITALGENVSLGAFNLKAATVFAHLLPSAQIESPIADARSNGIANAVVEAGAPVVQTLSAVWTTSASLYVGGAIVPDSLSIANGAVTLSDDGGVLKNGADEVGVVDYENGVLTLSTNVFGTGGLTYTVTYTPAAVPLAVSKSIGIPITINNRSLSYVLTLQPLPARRTLSVSYLTAGRWYVLRENGSGAVLGSDVSLGAGNLNRSTGTLTVTLGALPDVGSAIILQWVDGSVSGAVAQSALSDGGKFATAIDGAGVIVPGSLAIAWNDGTARTATDNSAGLLTGAASGSVTYANGAIRLAPTLLPASGTAFTVGFNRREPLTHAASNALSLTLGAGGIQPHSVRVVLAVLETYSVDTGGAWVDFHVIAGQTRTYDTNGPVLQRALTYAATDDGSGHLWIDGMVEVGTINYSTGAVVLDGTQYGWPVLSDHNSRDIGLSVRIAGADVDIKWDDVPSTTLYNIHTTLTRTRRYQINAQAADYTYATAAGAPVTITHTPTEYTLQTPAQFGMVLSGARFKLGTHQYLQRLGNLVQDPSAATDVGTPVGTVGAATGLITLSTWTAATPSLVSDWAATLAPPTDGSYDPFRDAAVAFRTAAAPIRPGSLSILGTLNSGATFNVTAGLDGKINHAHVKGRVNYETGVVELWFCETSAPGYLSGPNLDLSFLGISGVTSVYSGIAKTSTIRYNAVAYTYLPLSADILGLDPVRLPQDGRVPIFKAGRVIVIHSTLSMAPATVTNGQTVNTGRVRLARLRVLGDDGLQITSGYSVDLDAGTVTFSNVAGYSQPVTVEHRIEDEALCAEAQITGDLRLTRPLTHDFEAANAYVSSAMIIGDMQAGATESFSQQTWGSVWADAPAGDPIAGQYNQTLNPIVVTNQGAIQERWALIFTSSTAFRVLGQEVGQILTSNTGETCAPVNPATGQPYFSIAPAGWGSGWAAGNVLRFNTRAANCPVWVARTVLQSPAAPPGTDQMVLSVRGDINV